MQFKSTFLCFLGRDFLLTILNSSDTVHFEFEFKSEVTKLLEKHNVDILRATTKYKHTHTAFLEAFNKELVKLLFKPINAQNLQDLEKVLTIWVKNFNKIVNKMNNTKSSMIDMKPKDAIKLDTVPLDKTYPEETVLPKDGLYRYLYQPGKKHRDQKDEQQTLSGVKIRID